MCDSTFPSLTQPISGIVNTDGALWKEQRAFLHSVLRKLGAKSMTLGRDCLEHKIRVSSLFVLLIGVLTLSPFVAVSSDRIPQ